MNTSHLLVLVFMGISYCMFFPDNYPNYFRIVGLAGLFLAIFIAGWYDYKNDRLKLEINLLELKDKKLNKQESKEW